MDCQSRNVKLNLRRFNCRILAQIALSRNGVEIGKSTLTHATTDSAVECKQNFISVSSTK